MEATYLKVVNHLRPLLFNDGVLLVSRGNKLLRTTDDAQTLQPVASLNMSLPKQMLSQFSLTQRLLRLGMHELVRLDDGALLGTVRGSLVRLDPGSQAFRVVFPVPQGSRPLRLCPTPDGRIYFGEYFSNDTREAVNIWGSEDGGLHWQVVHGFAPGEIRHVHGVFFDPHRQGCWVLTGDEDPECRILFTSDHFKTLDTVVAGTQMARSVTLFPLENGLITASDTPFEQNYIHWLDTKTGRLDRVQPVAGSVFYSATVGDYRLLSTAVEPSPVNHTKSASVWFSKDGTTWKELVAWPQDRWAGRYLQYATFHFPRGHNASNHAYAYGQALQGAAGSMLIWDLDAAWSAV